MKPLFTLLFSLSLLVGKAQDYLHIKDTRFLSAIKEAIVQHKLNASLVLKGDSLIIHSPDLVKIKSMSVCCGFAMIDLKGLEYFTGLETFSTGLLYFSSKPVFPASLKHLSIHYALAGLTDKKIVLPDSLEYLDISGGYVTDEDVPVFPTTLKWLNIFDNRLTKLPQLPLGIEHLEARANSIASIDSLPTSLTYLDLNDNLLQELPSLPTYLQYLSASGNKLTKLPQLPASLITLNVVKNQLTQLPPLPAQLVSLAVSQNNVALPSSLPNSLTTLYCSKILAPATLPTLPPSLTYLDCSDNQLGSLPHLPDNLCDLMCGGNSFLCLPNLPANFSKCYKGSGYITGCSNTVCTITDLTSQNHPSTLDIYPNPAKGLLNISTSFVGKFIMRNTTGQVVFQTEIRESTQMDIAALRKGLYIYTFETIEGTQTGKVFLE